MNRPSRVKVNRFDNRFSRMLKPHQKQHIRSAPRQGGNSRITKRVSTSRRSKDGDNSARHSPEKGSAEERAAAKKVAQKAVVKALTSNKIVGQLSNCIATQQLLEEASEECEQIRAEHVDACAERDQVREAIADHEWGRKTKRDSSLYRTRLAQADAGSRARELFSRWQDAQARLARGESSLRVLEHTLTRMALRILKEGDLINSLGTVIKLDMNREYTFATRPDDPRQEEHTQPPRQTEEDNARESIREERMNAYTWLCSARENLENHQRGYWQARNKHYRGSDPGLPGWQDSWSMEEFDVAHLQQGMQLTRTIKEAEDAYRRTQEWAQDVLLTPMTAQTWNFPDRNEGRGSSVGSVANEEERRRVVRWADQLPNSPPAPEPDGLGIVVRPSESPALDTTEMWDSQSAVDLDARIARMRRHSARL